MSAFTRVFSLSCAFTRVFSLSCAFTRVFSVAREGRQYGVIPGESEMRALILRRRASAVLSFCRRTKDGSRHGPPASSRLGIRGRPSRRARGALLRTRQSSLHMLAAYHG
jgi:hypothetical protein